MEFHSLLFEAGALESQAIARTFMEYPTRPQQGRRQSDSEHRRAEWKPTRIATDIYQRQTVDGVDYARVCDWHRWMSLSVSVPADVEGCPKCQAIAAARTGEQRYARESGWV